MDRRKARVVALQALYEQETSGHPAGDVLERLLSEKEYTSEAMEYAAALLSGVRENRPVLDEQITRYAPAWPLEQLATIDRNILRLAIFEILFNNEVPVKVAINEAVELAKTFSGDNSPRFINGVLGSVSVQARR